MKYLETILSFIIRLAGLLTGRKKKKKREECINSFPDCNQPPFASYERDGSNIGSYWGDPGSIRQERDEISPVNIMGWSLILISGISSLFG